MNIYFLVEGKSTESSLYPAWIAHLIPELIKVEYFHDVDHNNYYLFNSNGIPDIENDIVNAIKDINSIGKYNYFVICVDADAATISQRETKILNLLKEKKITLANTSLQIIVQNRCIETWFLGNRKVYTRNPHKDSRFIEYSRFYNVLQNDPELMKKIESYNGSISNFHLSYLKAMFNERGNMIYSKSNTKEVQKLSYLNELISRIEDVPTHLNTFGNFIKFCEKIRHEIKR